MTKCEFTYECQNEATTRVELTWAFFGPGGPGVPTDVCAECAAKAAGPPKSLLNENLTDEQLDAAGAIFSKAGL